VHLIYGRDYHPEMRARVHPRVRVEQLPALVREISPAQDWRCLLDLRRRMCELAPDVVHTHESKAGVLGRVAARLAGAKCVVHTVHILAHLNAGVMKGPVFWAADWVGAALTDAFIDVSEGMREESLRAALGRADQHVIIESGMDIAAFRTARPPADRSLLAGIEVQDPKYLLVAGALEPRKRVAEFLETFAKLRATAPQACLLVAGEGPEQSAIKDRIAALGLSGSVAMLGHRPDLANWIALADVCVHASSREGLPRVVVQYVAAGKPVVVAQLPGIGRVVGHGANGFVTDADDLDAMVAPLASLVNDPMMRARMAAASAASDLSAWSTQSMVSRIENVYSRALPAAYLGREAPVAS
jgi:glycosyltransferase involved in cell wall biosynthesis